MYCDASAVSNRAESESPPLFHQKQNHRGLGVGLKLTSTEVAWESDGIITRSGKERLFFFSTPRIDFDAGALKRTLETRVVRSVRFLPVDSSSGAGGGRGIVS